MILILKSYIKNQTFVCRCLNVNDIDNYFQLFDSRSICLLPCDVYVKYEIYKIYIYI